MFLEIYGTTLPYESEKWNKLNDNHTYWQVFLIRLNKGTKIFETLLIIWYCLCPGRFFKQHFCGVISFVTICEMEICHILQCLNPTVRSCAQIPPALFPKTHQMGRYILKVFFFFISAIPETPAYATISVGLWQPLKHFHSITLVVYCTSFKVLQLSCACVCGMNTWLSEIWMFVLLRSVCQDRFLSSIWPFFASMGVTLGEIISSSVFNLMRNLDHSLENGAPPNPSFHLLFPLCCSCMNLWETAAFSYVISLETQRAH